LENDFKHFGRMRVLNKHFWGEFEGNTRPKTSFKCFS